MWSTAREIAAGDLVIIWQTRESLQPLVITPGSEYNGKFGAYRHSDLIGVPYGSKVASRNGKGFIHVLRPTPELWTMALPHRTQILYLADIAFVVSYLNIRPGSTVIEAARSPEETQYLRGKSPLDSFEQSQSNVLYSRVLTILTGTGSGSFSHSVARTIGPSGCLYSYEFHEARANKAREEFRRHDLSNIITLTHRNVCKDGFTIVDEADSVFLDLPAPWDAVQHAKRAMRKDRISRICCFSPCMEQVLRTVSALNDAGFTEVTMYETLLRPHEVHTIPSLRSIREVSDKLKESEKRREAKRLIQVAASQTRREKGGKKRKRGGQGTEGLVGDVEVSDEAGVATSSVLDSSGPGEASSDAKKLRIEVAANQADRTTPSRTGIANAPIAAVDVPSVNTGVEGTTSQMEVDETQKEDVALGMREVVVIPEPPSSPAAPRQPDTVVVSKVVQEVRGHTSYLTFAVLLPNIIPSGNSNVEIDEILAKKINLERQESGLEAGAGSSPEHPTVKSESQDVQIESSEAV